jgi:phage terminase large subunit-like protein
MNTHAYSTVLKRWRCDPTSFIEQCIIDPETSKPFVLLPAERWFFKFAFERDEVGRLLYPEQVFAAPKKSGKTTFAALHALVTTWLFGGSYPEVTLVANDMEQAKGRVFEMCRRIVECSPLLKREAYIIADRIEFHNIKATIRAIAADYAGAAGGNQTSRSSTNCGHTRASAQGACGTNLSLHQQGRSPVA